MFQTMNVWAVHKAKQFDDLVTIHIDKYKEIYS